MVTKFRRLTQDVCIVGRETLGAVEEQPNAGLANDWHAMNRSFDLRRKMVPVVLELDERFVGKFVGINWFGYGLKEADQESSGLFLDVGVTARISKRRQSLSEAFDVFGHEVKVLAAVQRNTRTSFGCEMTRPESGTGDNSIGSDLVTVGGADSSGPATRTPATSGHYFGNAGVLEDPGAHLFGGVC